MSAVANVVTLPTKHDPSIFDQSTALTWESLLRTWVLILMVIAGVISSVWGYNEEIKKERVRATQAFQTEVLQQSNAFKSYLENTLSALTLAVTDTTIGGYNSDIDRDMTQGMGKAIKNLMDSSYVVRYVAWAANEEGSQFPVRSVYYSPYYGAQTEHLTMQQNLALTPAIKQAMDRVLENGRPALASLGEQEEVIALAPVYRSSQQATRQQRSANLAGFVAAVIDTAAMIEVGLQLAGLDNGKTQPVLLDKTQPGSVAQLYNRYGSQHHGASSGQRDTQYSRRQSSERFLSYAVPVTTGGISWDLRFTAPYLFYGKEIPISAWVVLIMGLLITGTIAGFAASITRSARIEKVVHRRTAELKDAHEKVRESEMMLIQAEKLSSIGEMVAGVAHEINTPLGFIRCNLEMLDEQLVELKSACSDKEDTSTTDNAAVEKAATGDFLMEFYKDGRLEDLATMIADTAHGVDRISEIVVSLKDFSRMDRLTFDETDLHRCIDSTLTIAHNKIKHNAEVIKDFGELPLVSCASGQINQVLLNMIVNAAQSMEGFGHITITTRAHDDKVSISIQDNGKGMSEETKKKIFQPFFTTKDVGKGTGLGLSISEKIIRQHNGEILVDSVEGVGTTFTIILPIHQALAKAA